jgi:hypothetical protein
MPPDLSRRCVHPAVRNEEIWPGAAGYPWATSGIRLWTREGLLCRTGTMHLVATWTTGGFSEPTDGNFTMVTTSADNGGSWQPAGRLQHPRLGLFTTSLFTPRPGEVHAFLQTYHFGEWMTGLRSYRTISHDHGRSWSTPHSLPGGVDNVWVNKGLCLASGRWVFPVSWAEHTGEEWGPPTSGRSVQECRIGLRLGPHTELPAGADAHLCYKAGNAWANRNHRYCCGVLLSDDQGQTFRRSGYLTSAASPHLIEPRVVELAAGHLVMLIRSMDEPWLWRSESRDGGQTWSPPARSDLPNPSAKILLLKAGDGRVFLVHNPTGGACQGGSFAMAARNPLALWVSHDGMQSWPTRVDLVRDTAPGVSLNYPDGYLDEEHQQLDLVWEDTYSVYRLQVPMDIGPATPG